MKEIGIMQGRLSRTRKGKIQAFPTHDWEKEFELVAEIGYGSIEWVIDSEGIDKNPLFSENQRKTIHKLVDKYNILIHQHF